MVDERLKGKTGEEAEEALRDYLPARAERRIGFQGGNDAGSEGVIRVDDLADLLARAGGGPALVHAHVTRPYSHSAADTQSKYRSADELAEVASEFGGPRRTTLIDGDLKEVLAALLLPGLWKLRAR